MTLLIVAPLYPSECRADGPATWTERPLALEMHVGAGTPLGALGAAADWSFAKWLSVSAGVGLGTDYRLQGMGGARARLLLSDVMAVSLGTGSSVGNYVWKKLEFAADRPYPRTKEWSPAYWLNIDVGVEWRWDFGFLFRTYVGYGTLLNHNTDCITGGVAAPCAGSYDIAAGTSLFYLGAVWGYAFRFPGD